MITVRSVTPADAEAWLRLRHALWPEQHETEHRAEIDRFLAGRAGEPLSVLLAVEDATPVGFVELSLRAYAEGCDSSPVAFLEGWFVDAEARGRGVGRALIRAAEDWARVRGCRELASDARGHDEAGATAHRAVGFEDVGLIRCFRKELSAADRTPRLAEHSSIGEAATAPAKAVYLLVVPGFADWEPAHAVAELRRHGQYRVEVVGLSADVVPSMGGVTVRPSRTLAAVDPSDVAVFILPGGDRWEQAPVEPELVALLDTLDRQRIPIAAICAATTAIARAGLIRGRRHTSNGLSYLEQQVPGYTEHANYVDAPAVRDRGLITASGLADVEFAFEIMAQLEVLDADNRARWTTLFRSGLMPRT